MLPTRHLALLLACSSACTAFRVPHCRWPRSSAARLLRPPVACGAGEGAASVQFLVTQRMLDRLAELGYAQEEALALEPARAAAIVENTIARPPSGVPAEWNQDVLAAEAVAGAGQRKPKSKRDRFELQFTCKMCGTRNVHLISRHAYTKGTVIATCPGCNATHLIADNLNWIEDDFKNLEEVMAKRGTPVTSVVDDGVARSAAAAASAAAAGEADDEADEGVASDGQPDRLEGISVEQANRIREAVRGRKKRKRPEDFNAG
jgi:protein import protein ZIM17